eukprot:TRINITY_DN1892_c0_g1_i1.p1 TRINITY_DN1892_c0_g1~~TRINITY_DN1892_c0_g1_i1.p1  ORF type:complete len:312 (-),score=38.02 TRINITY_DN1892_c0_g1_i1:215-1150(-)
MGNSFFEIKTRLILPHTKMQVQPSKRQNLEQTPTLQVKGSPDARAEAVWPKEEDFVSCEEPSQGSGDTEWSKEKKRYSVISQEARQKFLDLVLKGHAKIKEAAAICGLKFSTSKAILSTYRREGRIGKKKTRARKTKIINTLLVAEVNPLNPSQATIIPVVSVTETKLMPDQLPKDIGQREQKRTDGTDVGAKALADSTAIGNDPEQLKTMIELSTNYAKVGLVNEIQNFISRMAHANQQAPLTLICLQNSLQQMSQQYKSNIQSLLSKRTHSAAALSWQQPSDIKLEGECFLPNKIPFSGPGASNGRLTL